MPPWAALAHTLLPHLFFQFIGTICIYLIPRILAGEVASFFRSFGLDPGVHKAGRASCKLCLVTMGIELVPSGSGPAQAAASPFSGLIANLPFSFAELCNLQFTLLSQPEQTIATPSLSGELSPQPNDKAGPPAAINAKGGARSDPAPSPASSFSSFFPFLPSPVMVPAPEPVAPQAIAPPGLSPAETLPSTAEAASPNPALPAVASPQSATNTQTAAETLFSLPLAIPIAEGPAPAAASSASAKSDSKSSSIPAPTAPAPQPVATPSSAAIANATPRTSPPIVTPASAAIANATPEASAPIASAWSDAIVNATPAPTGNQTAPADPGPLNSAAPDSAAPSLTAATPIPQELVVDSAGCFDSAPSPSLARNLATPSAPDAAVAQDSCVGAQSAPTLSVLQAAAEPVSPDSPYVASVAASPNRSAAGPKAEVTKTRPDAPAKDPTNDAAPREFIATSSLAARVAVPGLLSVSHFLPETERPVTTVHTVNPSGSIPAAAPLSVALNAPLVQSTFPAPASSSGLNRAAENFASPASTAPAPISTKNSQSESSGDNSSDPAPRKDPGPATVPSVAASPSSSAASPTVSAAPPLLATPPATIDSGAQPPAGGPTPSTGSSAKPDAHTVAPDSARNLPPETPPSASLSGPVQAAQILSKAAQSEMRIGLNTNAFGNVEVRTVVRSNDVGIQIGSEKGDLPSLLSNDIPGIANSLQRQDLNLTQVSFHQQGFAFSGDASADGQTQARSFASRPQPFSAFRAEQPIPEATPAEPVGTRTGGLSILA